MTQNIDHVPPSGLRTRGTVIVVPGRGENHAEYVRLGSRLAYDAYRVRVVSLPATEPDHVAGFLGELAQVLSEASAALAAEAPDGLVRPLVLVGADLGAAGLAALLAESSPTAQWWPEAVVLAGLPASGARIGSTWDDELEVRSHCPTHRGVLSGDQALQRGALTDALPADLLEASFRDAAALPHLFLVGDADPLADRGEIARLAKSLPLARLAVVCGGHHDVLNDLQHRSVAAEMVGFLEALRSGLVPAIAVEASAW